MSLGLVITEEAQKDIRNIYLYYEDILEGLGERFMDAVENCMHQIVDNPRMFQVRKHNCRFGRLAVFPYVVIYEWEATGIVVYAVFSTRRRPSGWRKRLR
ncbi:MAG: type II toxin-antitoxin system RelE/ParE family toxin [Flavobacteriales bacterium]|nr:type II toxin-antitoxin system RelE/ParE family toxin [Flavobacteriales bacterium]MCB9446724.1 type II toxin-antitoxin system RelE/ParE family toxin [Flavobacteriales bacterium]